MIRFCAHISRSWLMNSNSFYSCDIDRYIFTSVAKCSHHCMFVFASVSIMLFFFYFVVFVLRLANSLNPICVLFFYSCWLFLILLFQCYLLQFQISIYFQLHLINFFLALSFRVPGGFFLCYFCVRIFNVPSTSTTLCNT